MVKQDVKGNNNTVIGENHGDVINNPVYKKVTEIVYDEDKYITDSQAKEIHDIIDELVSMLSSGHPEKRSKLYPQEWNAFKKHFKITKYQLLPKTSYEDAIKWLKKRKAYHGRPKLRLTDKTRYRKDFYKGIYARIKNLNMTKEELFVFAEEELKLKQPINSLTELSDTRLKKLYHKIYSKKI